MMTPNPILEELYRVRDEYAASFNNDLTSIVDDIRRQQEQDGGEVVTFPPRRPKNWKEPIKDASDKTVAKVVRLQTPG